MVVSENAVSGGAVRKLRWGSPSVLLQTQAAPGLAVRMWGAEGLLGWLHVGSVHPAGYADRFRPWAHGSENQEQ